MVLKQSRLLLLVVLATIWMLGVPAAEARHTTSPDLFYNYYVPPGPSGGVGAELYVSPRPAPPMVGHTWVTYQPLLPHEFMYRHNRCYVRHNPGAGLTCTKVHYCRNRLQSIVPVWMDGPILGNIFFNPFEGAGKYYNP